MSKRVKKEVIATGETTVFVYSSGKLVAEYSTAAPSANPTTNYTATDMLGSPRVLTDSFGNVVSRRDFLPFGEELYADGVHRSVAGFSPTFWLEASTVGGGCGVTRTNR